MTSKKSASHPWTFRARFRRDAFGWKSQPAIARVREAVAEIKKVSKREPLVAAEAPSSSSSASRRRSRTSTVRPARSGRP
jgi:hypothetical protein